MFTLQYGEEGEDEEEVTAFVHKQTKFKENIFKIREIRDMNCTNTFYTSHVQFHIYVRFTRYMK